MSYKIKGDEMGWECDRSGDEEKDYRFWSGSLLIEDMKTSTWKGG